MPRQKGCIKQNQTQKHNIKFADPLPTKEMSEVCHIQSALSN